MTALSFDDIGYWSELKLDIVKKYAAAYSTILAAQPGLYHVYVDAFAGPGIHISRTRGEMVAGSPLNALQITPPFREYHLIDLDAAKVGSLQELVGHRDDVHFHTGDCNTILLQRVFPRLLYALYRRGLVLLDPYGLHLTWEVVKTAGHLGTIDMFLNFPVMDMNRNVLWSQPDGVDPSDIERMNAFWGDGSWRPSVYHSQGNLFGGEDLIKGSPYAVVSAYRERLRKVARFHHVPEPLPMRNSSNSVVYYLFFASQKAVAGRVVEDIFDSYKRSPSERP